MTLQNLSGTIPLKRRPPLLSKMAHLIKSETFIYDVTNLNQAFLL